eukprot:759394-Hanusia_phi.AAC.10
MLVEHNFELLPCGLKSSAVFEEGVERVVCKLGEVGRTDLAALLGFIQSSREIADLLSSISRCADALEESSCARGRESLQLIGRVFHGWRKQACEDRAGEQKLLSSLFFWKRNVQRSMFVRWHLMLDRMVRELLSKTFERWTLVLDRKAIAQRYDEVANEFILDLKLKLIKRALNSWAKFSKAVVVSNFSLVHTSFKVMCEYAQRRRSKERQRGEAEFLCRVQTALRHTRAWFALCKCSKKIELARIDKLQEIQISRRLASRLELWRRTCEVLRSIRQRKRELDKKYLTAGWEALVGYVCTEQHTQMKSFITDVVWTRWLTYSTECFETMFEFPSPFMGQLARGLAMAIFQKKSNDGREILRQLKSHVKLSQRKKQLLHYECQLRSYRPLICWAADCLSILFVYQMLQGTSVSGRRVSTLADILPLPKHIGSVFERWKVALKDSMQDRATSGTANKDGTAVLGRTGQPLAVEEEEEEEEEREEEASELPSYCDVNLTSKLTPPCLSNS